MKGFTDLLLSFEYSSRILEIDRCHYCVYGTKRSFTGRRMKKNIDHLENLKNSHQEINLFERDKSISQTPSCTLILSLLVNANALQTPVVVLTAHIAIIPLCPDICSKGTFQFPLRKNVSVSVQWKKTNILIVVTIIQQRTKTSSSSPSFNKNNLCRRGQGVKRKLKDVVSCLESKSMCSCFQAVKSCSKSCGCENPFGKNEGQDLQLPIQ